MILMIMAPIDEHDDGTRSTYMFVVRLVNSEAAVIHSSVNSTHHQLDLDMEINKTPVRILQHHVSRKLFRIRTNSGVIVLHPLQITYTLHTTSAIDVDGYGDRNHDHYLVLLFALWRIYFVRVSDYFRWEQTRAPLKAFPHPIHKSTSSTGAALDVDRRDPELM